MCLRLRPHVDVLELLHILGDKIDASNIHHTIWRIFGGQTEILFESWTRPYMACNGPLSVMWA